MKDVSAKPRASGDFNDSIAALSPAKRALVELRLKKSRTSAPVGQTVARRSGRESLPPLSFAQQRLWFLDQLEPNSALYNIPTARRLYGQLNVEALQKSVAAIVERHEVLRTTFASVDGSPVQIINTNPAVALTVIDLSRWPKDNRELEVQRLVKQEARRPFNLSSDLMLRSILIHLNDDENVLLVVMHHIASDGWSIGLFFQELGELYGAFCDGRPSPLRELPIQYADYAIWQQQWLQGEVLEKQLSYWKKQLSDISALQLPTDRPRPAIQSHRGARQSLIVSKELTESLNALSRKVGASLFMTLLAALQILLHRLTGQDDIAVGSPIAGRNRSELEGLIGFFLNTLVLRTDLSGQPTFTELLARVRTICLEAYAHQDIPFEKLLQELRLERDLSRTPLFQVFFNMVNITGRAKPEGVKIETVATGWVESKFDLTIYVRERDGGLHFNWVYNSDLFDRDRIQEMSRQYEKLLSQIVEHPAVSIHSYSLLTAAAQELLPSPVEPLGSDWAGSVHDRFSLQARYLADHPAITDPHGSWTYAELNSRSNQLAHYLLRSGIQREEIVAVYAHRSASLAWALLGILKAGAAFLVLDPAYPAARLIQYIRAAKPRGFIKLQAAGAVSEELDSVLRATVDFRFTLPELSGCGADSVFEGYSNADPEIEIRADDLAYVAYTSGSTGRPNGILGTHRPLSHFLRWQAEKFALLSSERFSLLSGLSYDPALRDIFMPLWLGGTLCVPDPEQVRAPGYLSRWIKREEITIAHLAPTMIQLLNESGSDANVSPANGAASSLRYAFFGGDSLTKRDLSKFQKFFPSATCVNFYGATETPQAMGYFVIPQNGDTGLSGEITTEKIPLGRGIEGAQLLVLNDSEQLAGMGELGEIYVRTPYLARGYLRNNALTQQRFIVNPFNKIPGDRLYKTGDRGRYLVDGNVEYVGRTDHQVKVRGFRIELGEIETVLCQNPAVRQGVVLVREEIPGDKRIAAYVVSRQGKALATNDLRDFLNKKLPDYMVPSAFVIVDSLPLTPNGKIDRKALPIPDNNRPELEESYVAPHTPVEELLAGIWTDILKIERVGLHDNFFDLGGYSLLAIKVIAQLRKKFDVDVPVRTLFEAPTIAQLAARLETQTQPVVGSNGKITYSHLIELRSRSNQKPVFCFPFRCGVQGEYNHFLSLAPYMAEYSFYGLQANAAHSQTPLHATIEELAAEYVREIEEFQPNGPYYLIGDCAGATEAYETARQLSLRGKKVGLLVLLDAQGPYLPERYWRIGPYSIKDLDRLRGRLLRSRLGKLATAPSWHWEESKKLTKGKRWLYLGSKALKMIRDPRWQLEKSSAGSSEEPEDAMSASEEQLLKCVYRARNQYRSNWPSGYKGRLAVIINKRWYGFDRTFGWAGMAAGGIERHAIPGNHISYMLEYVPLVAERLRACLENAEKEM